MSPHLQRCQWVRVGCYTLAIGRLEAGALLLRRIYDLDFRSIRV